MMPMMQSMDMKAGEQNEEQVGGSPEAPQSIGGGIGDPSARCIAETIVNNVNIIGDAAIQAAQQQAQEGGGGLLERLLRGGVRTMSVYVASAFRSQ